MGMPKDENEENFAESDWPGVGNPQRVATYSEKLEIGYRWYDTHGVQPAFPFGHGLSYTSFSLSNLRVSYDSVSVTVTNTGKLAGVAVPQPYLKFPEAAGEPPMQLKGFSSVMIEP